MASRNSSLVEGPLSKWTNVVSGWQYRWFVLDQSAGLLAYYTVSICTKTLNYLYNETSSISL